MRDLFFKQLYNILLDNYFEIIQDKNDESTYDKDYSHGNFFFKEKNKNLDDKAYFEKFCDYVVPIIKRKIVDIGANVVDALYFMDLRNIKEKKDIDFYVNKLGNKRDMKFANIEFIYDLIIVMKLKKLNLKLKWD